MDENTGNRPWKREYALEDPGTVYTECWKGFQTLITAIGNKKSVNRLTYTVFLLIIGISFFSAYAQNGPVKEYYPNGQLKKEAWEKRGTSFHKEYFPDGQLKYTRKVKLKAEKKITKVYYRNGKLKSILRNKHDKKGNLIGKWKFYGTDGKLESEQFLENGTFISTKHFRDYTSCNESGTFKIEIVYIKGKWKGRGGNFTRMYDKNGILLNETPLDESQRWP